jgi:HlyD family secretion protein
LVEVGDPSQLEAVIEVLSRDGASVPPGAKVELDQWGGGEPIEGRVRLVEPAAFLKVSALGVEEQRVNVIVDLVTPFDQRRSLGDAFRVEGRIVVWEADGVLKLPSGALFRHGQEWAAYVLANGRAELRPVRVGRSSGTETQILEGLNERDEVILYPGDRVKEGSRVRQVKVGGT